MIERDINQDQKEPNEDMLRARVELDAREYIDLMKKENVPDNLSLNEKGKLVLDIPRGEKIFTDGLAFLNIQTVKDRMAYFLAFEEKAKQLLGL